MTKGSTEAEKAKWEEEKKRYPSFSYLFVSKPLMQTEKGLVVAPIKGLTLKLGRKQEKERRYATKLKQRSERRAAKRALRNSYKTV